MKYQDWIEKTMEAKDVRDKGSTATVASVCIENQKDVDKDYR